MRGQVVINSTTSPRVQPQVPAVPPETAASAATRTQREE